MANYDVYPVARQTDQGGGSAYQPGQVPSGGADFGPIIAIRKVYSAGSAGVADDITVFATLAQKVRVLSATLFASTAGSAADTVTLRDAASAGGNALFPALTCSVTGVQRNAGTSTRTIAAGGSIYARRTEANTAGEIHVLCQVEA